MQINRVSNYNDKTKFGAIKVAILPKAVNISIQKEHGNYVNVYKGLDEANKIFHYVMTKSNSLRERTIHKFLKMADPNGDFELIPYSDAIKAVERINGKSSDTLQVK